MKITRRTFVNLTSAAVVAAPIVTSVRAATVDDPLGIRADFPLLKTTNFLNTAYHSVAPTPVVETGVQFYKDRANPADGIGPWIGEGHEVRAKFAKLVGADAGEIGLIHATSDAENIIANALDLKQGDNVVIDDLHYAATFVLYDHFKNTKGVDVRIVKRDETGATTLDQFEKMVDDKTRIVSVSWVSHENGYQHDLKALSEIAHNKDAYFYVDAIQGVGMLELDVKEAGIDFFGCGTYKWLLGSYGVAFFYIRKELLDIIPADRRGMLSVSDSEKMTDFNSYTDAAKYGFATPAFGAISVVGSALDYLQKVGIGNIEKHTVPLAHQIREKLVSLDIKTDTPINNRSSIVTYFPGKDPAKVKALYVAENIKLT
ncbi:MAG: aminotransferase class V-fold PLP-dependent enzyme [Kordiimonadaceae bacterium]|jgi:selenocysteine lyase/cysteine desulfurase|nr:aminotransferase class V-fold PLP-dependent enzyme [Kordiimonadaceae bacterium]